MPEAGALCVLSKLWYGLWLFTSQRVTIPLSETLPSSDFLNKEYFRCRTDCKDKNKFYAIVSIYKNILYNINNGNSQPH